MAVDRNVRVVAPLGGDQAADHVGEILGRNRRLFHVVDHRAHAAAARRTCSAEHELRDPTEWAARVLLDGWS